MGDNFTESSITHGGLYRILYHTWGTTLQNPDETIKSPPGSTAWLCNLPHHASEHAYAAGPPFFVSLACNVPTPLLAALLPPCGVGLAAPTGLTCAAWFSFIPPAASGALRPCTGGVEALTPPATSKETAASRETHGVQSGALVSPAADTHAQGLHTPSSHRVLVKLNSAQPLVNIRLANTNHNA